jgi:hypothetical protein
MEMCFALDESQKQRKKEVGSFIHNLRPNENYEKEWYRVDEVHYFEPKHVLESMLRV